MLGRSASTAPRSTAPSSRRAPRTAASIVGRWTSYTRATSRASCRPRSTPTRSTRTKRTPPTPPTRPRSNTTPLSPAPIRGYRRLRTWTPTLASGGGRSRRRVCPPARRRRTRPRATPGPTPSRPRPRASPSCSQWTTSAAPKRTRRLSCSRSSRRMRTSRSPHPPRPPRPRSSSKNGREGGCTTPPAPHHHHHHETSQDRRPSWRLPSVHTTSCGHRSSPRITARDWI
mmetsp:Transcript_20842/g.48370  ORF Transcript_20842/g.48370 Transcript_20842/m.48370 type:complete len:229 (-) Transcript_20842:185-871(-)